MKRIGKIIGTIMFVILLIVCERVSYFDYHRSYVNTYYKSEGLKIKCYPQKDSVSVHIFIGASNWSAQKITHTSTDNYEDMLGIVSCARSKYSV